MSKIIDLDGLNTFLTSLKEKFQAKLISGITIKTLNGNDLLGNGNIEIQGGTQLTLNGSSKTSASIYAPTTSGTTGYELISKGSYTAPVYAQPTGHLYCSTSGSTTTKTVSCTNFTLVTGKRVIVKFTANHTGSSTPKLNVNSTGAKDMYWIKTGYPISSSDSWRSNDYVECIYDGSYWRCIDLSTKYQNELVSGNNIKTINNKTLLGSGNIEIKSDGLKLVEGGSSVSSFEEKESYEFSISDLSAYDPPTDTLMSVGQDIVYKVGDGTIQHQNLDSGDYYVMNSLTYLGPESGFCFTANDSYGNSKYYRGQPGEMYSNPIMSKMSETVNPSSCMYAADSAGEIFLLCDYAGKIYAGSPSSLEEQTLSIPGSDFYLGSYSKFSKEYNYPVGLATVNSNGDYYVVNINSSYVQECTFQPSSYDFAFAELDGDLLAFNREKFYVYNMDNEDWTDKSSLITALNLPYDTYLCNGETINGEVITPESNLAYYLSIKRTNGIYTVEKKTFSSEIVDNVGSTWYMFSCGGCIYTSSSGVGYVAQYNGTEWSLVETPGLGYNARFYYGTKFVYMANNSDTFWAGYYEGEPESSASILQEEVDVTEKVSKAVAPRMLPYYDISDVLGYLRVVKCTTAEYDAMPSHDPDTLYIKVDN